MHVAALLAVLPLAAASISFNGNVGPKLAFNSPVTLKWTTNAKPAKVFLVSGTEDANNIYALYDVVCDVWITNKLDQACTSDQNEVTWTPKDVPVGTYSFMALANDGSRGFSNFVSIDQGSGVRPEHPSHDLTFS
ncbi:uncharacterized protein B0I36DRAFT_24597 [Microdochium trichocladiopsis]|uniref:Ser-Thr-rich glycosyl-phosphatidyl-inositol-anchored membrane family-domain-containing protein n=1 Tax=Microdochium trichocladiopsis TaxID=1682393 RepID=A0A9P8YH34_9PEZI|nr:uncharacterized protein B0I36DRAFT_24597 [Microdochium trichocladiopsis]KAH7041582.1 hypothetical protein B0I36DRAFT_24597 [Microdochium trichocladiopsis]